MNKIGLLVLLIVINSSKVIAQQITPKIAFLEKWENSKSYLTLALSRVEKGRSSMKECTLSLSSAKNPDSVQNDQGQLPGSRPFHLRLDREEENLHPLAFSATS